MKKILLFVVLLAAAQVRFNFVFMFVGFCRKFQWFSGSKPEHWAGWLSSGIAWADRKLLRLHDFGVPGNAGFAVDASEKLERLGFAWDNRRWVEANKSKRMYKENFEKKSLWNIHECKCLLRFYFKSPTSTSLLNNCIQEFWLFSRNLISFSFPGLRVILALQSETQSVVDSANGEQLCVETATTSWEQAINDSGRAISMCADQSFSPINNATDDFHAFVVEQARLAFQVQNVLLNGLSEVNMMTDEDQIRSNVAEQTDDMYTWFNYDVIPSLFRQLDQFLKLEQTLPEEIRECVNAATSRLEDEAQVLRNTLDFCW